MYRTFNDLRILRFALYLEETLERYEEHLRSLIPEVPVRAHLARLFEEGPHHRSLKEAHLELARRADQSTEGLETEDILQTFLECELTAHDFYLDHLDRLSDSKLVQLFLQLAREEQEHAEAVREAMEILNRFHRPRSSDPSLTEVSP